MASLCSVIGRKDALKFTKCFSLMVLSSFKGGTNKIVFPEQTDPRSLEWPGFVATTDNVARTGSCVCCVTELFHFFASLLLKLALGTIPV